MLDRYFGTWTVLTQGNTLQTPVAVTDLAILWRLMAMSMCRRRPAPFKSRHALRHSKLPTWSQHPCRHLLIPSLHALTAKVPVRHVVTLVSAHVLHAALEGAVDLPPLPLPVDLARRLPRLESEGGPPVRPRRPRHHRHRAGCDDQRGRALERRCPRVGGVYYNVAGVQGARGRAQLRCERLGALRVLKMSPPHVKFDTVRQHAAGEDGLSYKRLW